MAKKVESFNLIRTADGKVDFHLEGKNGEIMTSSNQGFENVRDAKRAIASVRRAAARAEIIDKTGE